MCEECIDQRSNQIWVHQMRIYSILILTGLVMLVYDYLQFTGHHYGLGDAPLELMIMLVLGGLGLMGGIFGFLLAAFFKIWHARASS